MRKTSIITLLLIAMVMNACTKQAKDEQAEFLSVKKIHFKEYDISAILGMPADLVVLDDLVIESAHHYL